MNKLIALLFAFAIVSTAFAQDGSASGNGKHTLTFDRGFFTNTYTVDGKESNVDEVEKLLLDVPDADSKWTTGNILRYISWGIAGVGGFFIGYGIAESQSFDEEVVAGYKRTIGLGALIVVAGIIVEKVGNWKKDGAIELYNSENGKSAQKADSTQVSRIEEKSSFNIQLGPTPQGGFGLAFNF